MARVLSGKTDTAQEAFGKAFETNADPITAQVIEVLHGVFVLKSQSGGVTEAKQISEKGHANLPQSPSGPLRSSVKLLDLELTNVDR